MAKTAHSDILAIAPLRMRHAERQFEQVEPPMTPNVDAIERAFQLARGGVCSTVSDIKRQLTLEGYSADQIHGNNLLKQLRDAIATADRTARPFKR